MEKKKKKTKTQRAQRTSSMINGKKKFIVHRDIISNYRKLKIKGKKNPEEAPIEEQR